MTISYLGHSSFLLVSDAGTRVVTDPYGGIGYPFPHVAADLVTVSHGHYDHAAVSLVQGDPEVADKEGHFTLGDIEVQAFPCFHDDMQGRKRGHNLAFRFTVDGVTVLHLGDIGEPCNADFVKKVGKVDILLVPVGGVFTVDAAGAKQYVDAIAPKTVIPMHFKTPDLNIGIKGLGNFLELFPAADIVRSGPFKAGDAAFEGKIVVMERMK